MKKSKTLAEQIAELKDPTPKDIDPEDHRSLIGSGSEDISANEENGAANGREHYEQVGRSKLRRREQPALGPQYSGSRISRDALFQNNDDNISFDDYDENSGHASSFGLSDAEDTQAFGEEDGDELVDEERDFTNEVYLENGAVKGNSRPGTRTIKDQGQGASSRLSDMRNGNNGRQSNNDLDSFAGFSGSDNEEQSEGSRGSDEEIDISQNGSEDEEDDSDTDEETDGTEEDDQHQEHARRAELRKLMSQEQKAVVASITEATKADASKGRAVKQQRLAYDALLNTRIRMQKGLVAVNSLSAMDIPESTSAEETAEAYISAEAAALHLWNQLNDLLHDLHEATSTPTPHSKKRKFDADPSTPSAILWSCMQEQEVAALPYRRTTLEKWSARVRAVNSLPLAKKLNNTSRQPTITDVLNDHLSNLDRLIKRTKVPRSCAPIQAANGVHEAPDIYDDADFYQLQLKELVDQRMLDAAASPGVSGQVVSRLAAMRDAKTKKAVDTKASKGRKMRYTVHEKLQNFMAPEDRGTWGGRQMDELFGSLLGAKMRLEEGSDEGEQSDASEVAEAGLLLFRS